MAGRQAGRFCINDAPMKEDGCHGRLLQSMQCGTVVTFSSLVFDACEHQKHLACSTITPSSDTGMCLVPADTFPNCMARSRYLAVSEWTSPPSCHPSAPPPALAAASIIHKQLSLVFAGHRPASVVLAAILVVVSGVVVVCMTGAAVICSDTPWCQKYSDMLQCRQRGAAAARQDDLGD